MKVLEDSLGYGEWLHGEAVACGMVLASSLSARVGLVDESFVERLRRLLERAGLPVTAPRMAGERWLELMRLDKKASAGEIRFVLIEQPGHAVLRRAPDATVLQVIAEGSAPA